jgi:hypothetical protein
MAQYEDARATLRITNAARSSVTSISGIDPDLPAEYARNFATGIEKLYNNGAVTTRISITKTIV